MRLPIFGLTLVACLCLVHCQRPPHPDHSDSSESESHESDSHKSRGSDEHEKPLVRCRRPLCEVYCPGGLQMDESGCETCQCRMPCAEPMCANDCREFGGYKRDEHGCMNCECKEVVSCEDMECAVGYFCRSDFTHCHPGMNGECLPRPLCVSDDQRPRPVPDHCPLRKCVAVICEYGLKRDEDDCPTCDCATDPCESHECHAGQQCQLELMPGCEGITCPVVASCTFKTLCHLKQKFMEMMRHSKPPGIPGMPPPREMMEEMRDGPMADMMDGTGPMADMMDGPGPMGDMMDGPLGEMMRRAMDGPLGHMKEFIKGKAMDYIPKCESNGEFHPKQCNLNRERPECWCVDDRGLEVDGTRKMVMVGDKPSTQCERNHTEAMDVKFHVLHEFDDISPRLDDLKTAVREHLSRWLTIDERFIVIVKIEPDTNEMQLVLIHVVVMPDGVTDLPSAAFHMHDQMRKKHCNIDFQGQTMRSDPDTLQVKHRYGVPQMPIGEFKEEEDEDDEGVVSFCRAHRLAVLVGCVGGSIILLCLAVVIISVLRKKGRASHQFQHQRFDNYNKNLTLAGEIMKHPDDLGPEKEPSVAVISVTDTNTDTSSVA